MLKREFQNIVNPKWLHKHLNDKNLVILEVGQFKNKSDLEFNIKGSISGSIKVDLKLDFSNPLGQFPNTFPTVEQFETTCNRLGISNDSKVVIVDRLGIYSSPRIWFVFLAMGHKEAAILNGGLPAWVEEGYKISNLKPFEPIVNKSYFADRNPKLVKDINDVSDFIEFKNCILIDARSSERFHSLVPEPRSEIRNGNIPNSINIPFKTLLDGNRFKSKKELSLIFEKLNFGDKPLIFSCGSGVTACINMLASETRM